LSLLRASEVQHRQIEDGWAEGHVATTADSTLFGVQGVFIL
jgi:hypothetical protein